MTAPLQVEAVANWYGRDGANRVVEQAPLQWYGGKWEMAEWLASLLPRAQTFVMPFGGAGSPLWHVEPYPVEVYNDLDSELVNFFRVARDHGDELARRIELTPFSREEFGLCKRLDGGDAIVPPRGMKARLKREAAETRRWQAERRARLEAA